MTKEDAVAIVMKARGYWYYFGADDLGEHGWTNLKDERKTSGQALAECLDLNVLAEICKTHEWTMRIKSF